MLDLDLRALGADYYTGKTLPAHFTLHENQSRLSIVVDASEAHYPITVDPLATSPNWMDEGNQEDAEFSFSVGTAGDVNGDGRLDLLVGQSWDELRIYIGVRGSDLFAQNPQRVGVALTANERDARLVQLNRDSRQDLLIHHASTTEPHRVTTLIAR